MTEPVWKTYTTRNFSTLSYMACQRSDQYDEAVIIIHGITAELSEQKKIRIRLPAACECISPGSARLRPDEQPRRCGLRRTI